MSARVAAAAPFPGNVHAFTTLRHGAGASRPPFDSFNLGNFRGEGGDDPAVVARNRMELFERFGLPSWPHWLRQVHGTRVLRFDAPCPPPGLPPRCAQGEAPGRADRPDDRRAAPDAFPLPFTGEGRGGGSDAPAFSGMPPSPPPPAPAGGGVHLRPPHAGGEDDPLARHCRADRPDDRRDAPGRTGRGGGENIPPAGDEPEADAAVTAVPGVVLAILTADCLPVVFAARDGSEVAAAHAGWPGLSKGMLEAALAAMRTPSADVVAWIGPCAGPERYEVGRDVYDAFVSRDAGAAACFRPVREGHWLADLPALARRRLVAAGMSAADIHGGGLCTISDPARFFSHRRDGRSGRMATVVWMT